MNIFCDPTNTTTDVPPNVPSSVPNETQIFIIPPNNLCAIFVSTTKLAAKVASK